jgi:predicted enzyme related to lactoylglutathione lyase
VPARGALPEGAPAWIDLGTRDLDAAITFYTGLFGWEYLKYAEEEQLGGYGRFLLRGEPVAGVGPLLDDDQAAAWSVYLWTTDADATAARVTEHGGTVLRGPEDVPGKGHFLKAIDPTGAQVSFWQADDRPGFTTVGEQDAPAWFELWTNDYERAVEFYSGAALWDTYEMPNEAGWRYTTHGKRDEAFAGIYDATSDLGEHGMPTWVVYFGTANLDASVARARALGVTVLGDPQDGPYGRMVGVQDPNDTWFWLIAV